jgi:hypothetical protein
MAPVILSVDIMGMRGQLNVSAALTTGKETSMSIV